MEKMFQSKAKTKKYFLEAQLLFNKINVTSSPTYDARFRFFGIGWGFRILSDFRELSICGPCGPYLIKMNKIFYE